MIEDLKKRLMAPVEDVFVDGQHKREKAAVLLAIQRQPEPTLILTQRSSNLGSHGGEVAWPGGKHDAIDGCLETTLLRETWEEIGLPPEKLTLSLISVPSFPSLVWWRLLTSGLSMNL